MYGPTVADSIEQGYLEPSEVAQRGQRDALSPRKRTTSQDRSLYRKTFTEPLRILQIANSTYRETVIRGGPSGFTSSELEPAVVVNEESGTRHGGDKGS